MTQIVSYSTAHEIWVALEQLYASFSMARITELRTSLQNLKKDGLSAMEYIQKFKSISNNLAAIGEPVSRNDHLIYLFGGLGHEYNAFVTSIVNRPDKPSVEEVHSLLLSYEFRLERQQAAGLVNTDQI